MIDESKRRRQMSETVREQRAGEAAVGPFLARLSDLQHRAALLRLRQDRLRRGIDLRQTVANPAPDEAHLLRQAAQAAYAEFRVITLAATTGSRIADVDKAFRGLIRDMN